MVEHIDFTVFLYIYMKANKTHGEILAVLGNCSKVMWLQTDLNI